MFFQNRAFYEIKIENQSHYKPEVPSGFQEVKVPRLHENGPFCEIMWKNILQPDRP